MTSTATAVNGDPNGEQEETGPPPRYIIDFSEEKARLRSLPILIAARRCFACRQADEDPTADSDPKKYIKRIAEHCRETSDFLLPDTPLKEAIFRVMLSKRNKEITAEQVSEVLTENWSNTAYPRDITSDVIQRLMDQSDFYCISRIPEPEPEPEIEEDTATAEAEETVEEEADGDKAASE